MEVVKPRTRWTRERRFAVLGKVFDSEGSMARFERCSETLASGVKEQFLLQRVLLEGSSQEEETRWANDLESLSQLKGCRYILRFADAWVTDVRSRDMQHVLCANARMFLSVCLRELEFESEGDGATRPCRELYPLWLFHLAKALEYMHKLNNEDQPILHRDLQPDNVMVTDNCILQLCAFGTSKRLDSAQAKTGTVFSGGGLFQSPEIVQGKPYDPSADIWSFGVTAVYIANHKRARKCGSVETLQTIMRESGQNRATQDVVLQTLQPQPSARPSASQIVQRLERHYGLDTLQNPPPQRLFPPALVAEIKRNVPSVSKKTDTHVPRTPDAQTHNVSRNPSSQTGHHDCGVNRPTANPALNRNTADMTTQTSFQSVRIYNSSSASEKEEAEDAETQTSFKTIKPKVAIIVSSDVLQKINGVTAERPLQHVRPNNAYCRREPVSTTSSTASDVCTPDYDSPRQPAPGRQRPVDSHRRCTIEPETPGFGPGVLKEIAYKINRKERGVQRMNPNERQHTRRMSASKLQFSTDNNEDQEEVNENDDNDSDNSSLAQRPARRLSHPGESQHQGASGHRRASRPSGHDVALQRESRVSGQNVTRQRELRASRQDVALPESRASRNSRTSEQDVTLQGESLASRKSRVSKQDTTSRGRSRVSRESNVSERKVTLNQDSRASEKSHVSEQSVLFQGKSRSSKQNVTSRGQSRASEQDVVMSRASEQDVRTSRGQSRAWDEDVTRYVRGRRGLGLEEQEDDTSGVGDMGSDF